MSEKVNCSEDTAASLNVTREIRLIIATDCGSTTTKAILIEKRGDEYRLINRGEAPTTVEAPVEDVTAGVINAITELEELAGRRLLENGQIIKPQQNGRWRNCDGCNRVER